MFVLCFVPLGFAFDLDILVGVQALRIAHDD